MITVLLGLELQRQAYTNTKHFQMKKILIALIVLFTLNSCTGLEDDNYYGFEFVVVNHTSQEYNAEIVVGGFKDGVFIPTDSIRMDPIVIHKPEYDASGFFKERNRWNPDMQKTRAIPSDSCYFKLKLTNDRQEFIKKSETNDALFALEIPENNLFKNDNGIIGFRITETSIYKY